MHDLQTLLRKETFGHDDIVAMLSADSEESIEQVRAHACRILDTHGTGSRVFFRGLIEFSNQCVNDCRYCGIRAGNARVRRYCLTEEEIVEAARYAADRRYGSVVLQSGERRDERFVAFVEKVVRRIKESTRSPQLPGGLGVTLCVGEQTPSTYRRFFDAGAHRYLLRIETTSPDLYARLHPARQALSDRIKCLTSLKEIGYQVGTGVMIGLPGQTVEDLARDIAFFHRMDIDMIGMGPFIVHRDTPLRVYEDEIAARRESILRQSLLMIAAARIVLRDVNIAATTALQTIDPRGREAGLRFGANVLMPQLTPARVRRDYELYDGKPCGEENRDDCDECLRRGVASVGRELALDTWGDPPHFAHRRAAGNG